MERGESISIPAKDIEEPIFHHGQGGVRERVHPGNKDFVSGDTLPKPQAGAGGGGSGSGDASDSGGEGIDEFVFQISQGRVPGLYVEDLELPNLVKSSSRKRLPTNMFVRYCRRWRSQQNQPGPQFTWCVWPPPGTYRPAQANDCRAGRAAGGPEKAPESPDPAFSLEDQIKTLEDEIARLRGRIKAAFLD